MIVCLSQAGVVSKRLNIFGMRANLGFYNIMLEENSGISKIRALPSKTSFQTLDLEKNVATHVDHRKCCQLRWTLSVINWRRSSVASLSHLSIYNTIGLKQRIARACLRQLFQPSSQMF